MNSKSIVLFICILLNTSLIGQAVPYFTANTTYQSSNTFYVDSSAKQISDGSLEHPFVSIAEAFSHASDGDTIIVLPGTYHESLLISKKISIIGQEKETTIIDGGFSPYIFNVNTSDVAIKKLTLKNVGGRSDHAGIIVKQDNTHISSCVLYNMRTGIVLQDVSNCSISKSKLYMSGQGVFITNSSHCLINKCIVSQNGLGINTYQSDNITYQSCIAHTNGIGLFFDQVVDSHIFNCGVFNNNDNQGGIFLDTCHDINVNNSIIQHNGFGLKPSRSKNISITFSTIQMNTHAGLYIEESSENIFVKSCNITNNFRFGVYSEKSQGIVTNSNFFSSTLGFYAEHSLWDLSNNWWGSLYGPLFFEHPMIDKIRNKQSTLSLYPVEKNILSSIGASWCINTTEYPLVNIKQNVTYHLNGSDSDNDLLPDWWEEKYQYDAYQWDNHSNLDPDEDGLSNIEECYTDRWGSHPFRKDIFIEFDWMKSKTAPNESNKPLQQYIAIMQDIFSEHNISVHIDIGQFGGGEEIPYQDNFSFADLKDIYWDYFLHQNLQNPRKGIFHYCPVSDIGPGPGFAFIGWYHLDSFCICAEMLQRNQPTYPRQHLIIGGSIHELGHNLGLTVDDHGGNDNTIATWPWTVQWLKYRQYKSCMNYWYTYRILGFSDGSHGTYDFDDWSNMDFSFFKNTQYYIPEDFHMP